MTQEIKDPEYWAKRLRTYRWNDLHKSVYNTHIDDWETINAAHREILKEVFNKLNSEVSILDAGCAYGRLLELLPKSWHGHYTGVDLADCFVELAREKHPDNLFLVRDVRNMPDIPDKKFDWAVCVSIRRMILAHLNEDTWIEMEKELDRVARNILLIEYENINEYYIYSGGPLCYDFNKENPCMRRGWGRLPWVTLGPLPN